MKFSILTATYNRAKCLPKLYESLIKNKSNNSNKDRYIISFKEEKFLKEIINIKDKLNIETNKYNKPYLVNSDIK